MKSGNLLFFTARAIAPDFAALDSQVCRIEWRAERRAPYSLALERLPTLAPIPSLPGAFGNDAASLHSLDYSLRLTPTSEDKEPPTCSR